MKKLFIIIIVFTLFITGCSQEKNEKQKEEKPVVTEKTPEVDQYVDDNKMPISLYQDGDYVLTRVDSYKTKFTLGKDIGVFLIYPSTDKQVKYTNRFADSFYEAWKKYDTDKSHKMGYHLTYTLNDRTHISHYIFKPQDTMKYKQYIKIYLYDDYTHRNDSWYSHVTNEEYNDNTYLTSIKLTPGSEISKVVSNVELMAFTYNGLDDFENNGYRGVSKDILTIEQLTN